ncbi:hypothetical protein [Halalkalibacter alkaliphilus]|uniref:UPF0738 protein MF646_18635 n=1 Tax=Halalkalibacter alkaliphilus TaxID=2917993 RepID=A0A9X2IA51_9BACI|nr:hypothetical protein [Halalkalibacter alkaliphilus]MCL7749140.1 hypothetical protein [Halalkalibacter alkaliphilus]
MKKLEVSKIVVEKDQYTAIMQGEIDVELAETLQAGGRMLVDSDGLAFIYILEDESAFYYVNFSQETWPQLREVLSQSATLALRLNKEIEIELSSIVEELSFLTDNIEGNSNYGEEMEKAVQEIFN